MTFNREFTADPQNRGTTGDGLAEFMLGWPAAGNLGNENGENLMANSFAAFLQDDWKVSPRLTLNLGVRYDIFFAPDVPRRPRFQFPARLQRRRAPTAACRRFVRKTAAIAAASRTTGISRRAWAWRTGSAAKTVLRAGFGIIFAQDDYLHQPGPRAGSTSRRISSSTASPRWTASIRWLTLQGGFPAVHVARRHGARAGSGRHQYPGRQDARPVFASSGSSTCSANLPYRHPDDARLYRQRRAPVLVLGLDYNLPYGPAAATVASRRIFPYYTGVTRQMPMGNSVLQRADLESGEAVQQGLSFLSAFTWAHAIDDLPEIE